MALGGLLAGSLAHVCAVLGLFLRKYGAKKLPKHRYGICSLFSRHFGAVRAPFDLEKQATAVECLHNSQFLPFHFSRGSHFFVSKMIPFLDVK